jgi:16S rRNA (cytosine967-C5)-methyltransferase
LDAKLRFTGANERDSVHTDDRRRPELEPIMAVASPRMRNEEEVCDLILKAWSEVRRGRANTAHALAQAFRVRPNLAHETRAAVVDGLYGMLHEARRIDCALGLDPRAAHSAKDEARADRARYFAWRLLAGESPPDEPSLRALAIDAVRVKEVDARISGLADPLLRFALTHSLPEFLAARLLAEHGDDAAPLCASLRRRAPLALRVNTLKTERDALIERLSQSGLRARKSRFATDGIELEQHANVFLLAEFHAGWFEVQDEASQLVAEIVAPPPNGSVVDYCAGAGGKTLAVGARMKNQGKIVALDPSGKRLKELRRRAARAGLFNVQVPAMSAISRSPKASPAHADPKIAARSFDRVLVDAPCSGLGALRRKPDIRWRITQDELERLPEDQEAIATRAMELVAPGGRLIYSTCTLLADENERVVERLLARGGFEPVPVKEILGAERARAITDASGTNLKLFPHRHETDGFFAAVMRRTRG